MLDETWMALSKYRLGAAEMLKSAGRDFDSEDYASPSSETEVTMKIFISALLRIRQNLYLMHAFFWKQYGIIYPVNTECDKLFLIPVFLFSVERTCCEIVTRRQRNEPE